MTSIKENISLKPYNTFGFDVTAKYFCEVESVEELRTLLQQNPVQPILFLGGGSNILLLDDYPGLVIKISIKGIHKVSEDENTVTLSAGAGEVWHQFVLHTLDQGWGGLENMSLIPGTVGAAPMQNIGAYGAEVKDAFVQLKALNRSTLEIETFDRDHCHFGYRESFFKHEGKDRYVILEVCFRLQKNPYVNTTYGAIKDTLVAMGIHEPTVKDVSNAVIQIRRSKLPDPAEIGNSGSFFKNPEISKVQYDALKVQFPDLPAYPIDEHTVKVPAGWLIEHTGWKGKRFGAVGVHARQALVLVHYGGGKGKEIKTLAERIQSTVAEKFGIRISPEVNFIPNFT